MNIGEFLNTQATISGIAPDNDALKSLLANPELSKVNLPDEITAKIQSTLMTVEQAKTNAEVKKHFNALALNPVDTTIMEILNSVSELPDDVKAKFTNEKNSYTKIKMLADTIKELEGKKVGAAGGDKAKLIEQITSLNNEIVKIKADSVSAVGEVEKRYSTQFQDMALANHFKGYTYGTGLADEVNAITAKTLFENSLRDKKNASRDRPKCRPRLPHAHGAQ